MGGLLRHCSGRGPISSLQTGNSVFCRGSKKMLKGSIHKHQNKKFNRITPNYQLSLYCFHAVFMSPCFFFYSNWVYFSHGRYGFRWIGMLSSIAHELQITILNLRSNFCQFAEPLQNDPIFTGKEDGHVAWPYNMSATRTPGKSHQKYENFSGHQKWIIGMWKPDLKVKTKQRLVTYPFQHIHSSREELNKDKLVHILYPFHNSLYLGTGKVLKTNKRRKKKVEG